MIVAQQRDSVPLILTAALVFLLFALNAQLFTRPIAETTDFAANSLLVQQAKHFTLLTGHYSRWRFHHPGPAFLYLFALGEFLFHDLLHAVPTPYNGQVLMMIVFNGLLLCATLYVFRRHARLPVPLALLAIVVVSVIVNANSLPESYPPMLISNWMPDVMLFPFLLFTVSAASILAGRTSDVRWMAFSGMLLIHAHVVQLLFVGVIGGATVGYVLVRARRENRLHVFLSDSRRDFAVAGGIVLLFALPALLETLRDTPNNVQAILGYLQQFGDQRNNLGLAIGYFTCFLLFLGSPTFALPKGPLGILEMGLSRVYVWVYWVLLALLLLLALRARRRGVKQPPGAFLGYLTWIGTGSAVLFLYWSTRITGGMQGFNGHFIYSLHLLALFILISIINPLMNGRAARALNTAALAGLLVFAVAERKWLRSEIRSEPDALAAAASAPRSRFGSLAIAFTPQNWGRAAELAISMQRMGKPFCVNPDWGFMFSKRNVCPDLPEADKLWVTAGAVACPPPCRPIYHSAAFAVTDSPARKMALPVEAGPHGSQGVDLIGFNDTAGVWAWTEKHASILFWLSPEPLSAPCYRIAVTGFAMKGRPAQLSVNGRTLGTLSKTVPETALFAVPREAIRSGEVNRISLDTENAGPAGADRRELGFAFANVVLRAAGPDEGCTADPAPR
ncbi:MAG TPA: hypothetical protein VMG35_08200 [Bryobacteraceae bacterium]|nr:hypothetical protein [Bryobacteraceae bacterium]